MIGNIDQDMKYRLRPACQETERGMEQLKCEGRIDCIGGTRAQVEKGAEKSNES